MLFTYHQALQEISQPNIPTRDPETELSQRQVRDKRSRNTLGTNCCFSVCIHSSMYFGGSESFSLSQSHLFRRNSLSTAYRKLQLVAAIFDFTKMILFS